MKIPNLDNRDSSYILEQIKALAKQYVPEWRYDEEDPDFGVVFSKVFAGMFESTINRYNRSSYNSYVSFLNLLGGKLLPPTSATGMVKVSTVSGSSGVYIDKGTPLYASAETDQGKAFYQTEDSIFVTPAKIKGLFITDKTSDKIVKVYDEKEDQKNDQKEQLQPFRIFDTLSYDNLQHHIIYFENEKLFETKESTEITIEVKNSYSLKNNERLPKIFSNKELLSWQYFKGGNWLNIEDVTVEENEIKLKFNDYIDLCEVMGKESRYVRCVFNKIPDEEIKLTEVLYSSRGVNIEADTTLSNSTELAKNDFFPFEEQYTVYNDFYIAANEAFGKEGAKVDINIDMQFVGVKINTDPTPDNTRYKFVMTDMDFETKTPSDLEIEKVIWEYWNGEGWARLYSDNSNEDFFVKKQDSPQKKVLSFICPNNMKTISVGSHESRFIRARITKVKNQFNLMGTYITPYIHSLNIGYEYLKDKCECKSIFVDSNLRKYVKELPSYDETPLLNGIECESPAMYMCLDKPLTRGPIRIFFDVERGIYQDIPSVRYEYYAIDKQGKCGWKNIDVMDLTNNFSHSQIITIIGKTDFCKTEMFATQGYFIRIINHDKRYEEVKNNKRKPIINGIHFNTVSILQKETEKPEYFYVDRGEENKVCKLSHSGVCENEVWVNEKGNLSAVEQKELLFEVNDNVQVEYDSKGSISEIWVKWREIDNIISSSLEERVYEVDYSRGHIIFGNGKHGRIPSSQSQESIKVLYSTSQGSIGNVGANDIKGFSGSVPYISKVENLKPVIGGVDMETIDCSAKRMACNIKGMNRIVSIDDFEDAINYFDRNIYKVKCISHIDEYGEKNPGVISVVILPRDYMQGYEKFLVLRNRIEDYIKEKAPATLISSSKVQIFEARYVELSVSLDIVINDYNMYQNVYQDVYNKLREFLDPVSGNFDSTGWDIGQIPRKELIYNYIKNVSDIKWIRSINVFAKIITPDGKRDIDFNEAEKQKFIVPVFGEPEINMSIN